MLSQDGPTVSAVPSDPTFGQLHHRVAVTAAFVKSGSPVGWLPKQRAGRGTLSFIQRWHLF